MLTGSSAEPVRSGPLEGGYRAERILVPQRAVQQRSKGHFVWVVGEEGNEQRPVMSGDGMETTG